MHCILENEKKRRVRARFVSEIHEEKKTSGGHFVTQKQQGYMLMEEAIWNSSGTPSCLSPEMVLVASDKLFLTFPFKCAMCICNVLSSLAQRGNHSWKQGKYYLLLFDHFT